MKLFYRIAFVLLLGLSLGFTSKKDNVSEKYSYTKMFSEGETDGFREKVLVVKKTELKSLVDSIEKKYKAYISINRYERIDKAPFAINQSQLKIKLTREIRPAISTIDKPLVLGGEGFDTAGFEPVDDKLHFTFNSHLKAPPVHEVEREDATGYLDPGFERSRSEKFLIFHNSGSSFGRQLNLSMEPTLEQPVKEKMIHTKIDSISDTGVYPGRDKGAGVHPNPAKKPLDLIYGNPAILKYDYQTLNSSDF